MKGAMITPDTKKCNRCGEVKNLSEYSRAADCKDGHRNYCRVCHNTYRKQWADQNKEKRKISTDAYYWAHRDYYLQKNKEWLQNNREQARSQVNARRARVKQATPPWLDISTLLPIYKEAQILGLEVDHIIPINHPSICGLHVPWNLQLLTHEDNLSKGNRYDASTDIPNTTDAIRRY